MTDKINIDWFKVRIAPHLDNYVLNYRHFENGDFGDLDQVSFESEKIGGEIDFWSLGRLSIFIWSYEKEKQLLNILLEPLDDKHQVFNILNEILLN